MKRGPLPIPSQVHPRKSPGGNCAPSSIRNLDGCPRSVRLPLILCYLEGRSQEEAATQLGWSKSTLLRRLEEARAVLRRRLSRRGVVWPAALSAVLLSDCLAPAALGAEVSRFHR